MQMFVRVPLAVLVALTAIACNGGSSDPMTRLERQYTATTDAVCTACPMGLGHADTAACRESAAAGSPFMGPSWECQRRAYAQYTAQLGPFYDCEADAFEEFDGCVRRVVQTCPPIEAESMLCSDALEADLAACPRPDSIEASTAVSACFEP